MPLTVAQGFGALLGWVVFWASPAYRRRLLENAERAGVSAEQRRRAVSEAGRMVGELPWLWLAPPSRVIGRWVEWRDAEVVQEALADGRGLVLMTPHLGSFEVCAQAYAARFGAQAPLTALYRPARKAWLREVQAVSRHRPGLKTAPATLAGVRALVRALKAGETIGVLPDQVPPDGLGTWAPFFGTPAYTMTLASRLVQQTGARVVVLWGERRSGGRGWVVHALNPATLLPQGQSWDAKPEQINQVMEAVIRRAPHQYLWGYHRFKAPRGAAAE